MPYNEMDITQLLCIGRMLEKPLLLLFGGLLTAFSAIPTVSMIGRVDFPIVLLLLRGPLTVGLKKSSPGLRSLDAYVNDCEQNDHHFWLLHGYLLHGLDIANPVMKGIDDFDVLDIWDIIPGIIETFYVVSEALIMLLLDSLQGLYSRWMLVYTLKVPNECDT
jgi:hypothetical protein